MSFEAKIIADSKNSFGHRLTTFELVFPRQNLSEFNTHRALSKNSASSRAIPFAKMMEAVKTNPFIPMKWMKEHKGMQGTEYFTEEEEIGYFINNHLDARDYAIFRAEAASKRGLTKQACNRYLEPFAWHKVLMTATDLENFFALRAHPDAEIHIQELARIMLDVYNTSTPVQLAPGDWHIPYADKIEIEYNDVQLDVLDSLNKRGDSPALDEDIFDDIQTEILVKIATARCAQVSYTVVGEDEKPLDYLKLIGLHDRLLKSGHMSPFEHCARSFTKMEWDREYMTEYCGNFQGFIQYRKMIPNENRRDPRVLIK